MEQFFQTIKPALDSLLAVVLTTVFSYIGIEVKRLYRQFVDGEDKKEIIDSTVRYVEQVYGELKGPEKLSKALERAGQLLEDKGIEVTQDELRTLIEAAVHGLEKGYAGA